MYVIRLDTGQFYQASGTVTIPWANPNPSTPLTIQRTLLWGGISIGANMDFSTALYITGADMAFYGVGASAPAVPGWMPLDVLSFDRYGPSNGQPYQHWWDWKESGVQLGPGERLLLQANCVNHGGVNPVFNTPAAADNCHAQAYIWMT